MGAEQLSPHTCSREMIQIVTQASKRQYLRCLMTKAYKSLWLQLEHLHA